MRSGSASVLRQLRPSFALHRADRLPAVTITIKYTDDEFSIRADDDGLRWLFFPKVKIETEREERIRAIFHEQQTAPVKDYLFNAGKGRVLEYVLPSDKEKAVALCGRLLREVYEMRADDELIFSFGTK